MICRGRSWEDGCSIALVDKVPDKDERVVCAGGNGAAASGGPFDTVYRACVAF